MNAYIDNLLRSVSNRRPRHEDEEPRVLQVIPVAGAINLPNITRYRPGVNITAQLAPARQDSKSEQLLSINPVPARLTGPPRVASVLHVRLHGGHYVYGAQKADFQFICDPGVDEVRSASRPCYRSQS